MPIDMHKRGPSASLLLKQKGERREKGALQWSPYVSASGHILNRSREEEPSASLWCYFFVILPNDDRTCLLAGFVQARILTFSL